MKHSIARFSVVSGLAVLLILGTSAFGQSLGEAARKARQSKPPEPTTKVITNDDLNSLPKPPVSSAADSDANASAENKDAATADDKAKDKDKEKADAEKKSPDDQAKLDKEWGDKIAAQKDAIAMLEREIDVMQRENKLRAATFYADAGNRLRDEKKYAEDDRKYHDQIDAKQKELDDAKTKLDQLRDDARKAGASASVIG
ncbi:MAG: hypothetical protein JOZ44_17965 [Acidobacteria bacterium]|nr:hypothetical protein [Acidobacteriota bacterium]